MEYFIYVIIFILSINVFSKSIWLMKDDFPQRTRGQTVSNLLINFGLLMWTVIMQLYDITA